MGKYWIFLIALGVASANGIDVPAWAWVTTSVMAFIGSLGIVLEKLQEKESYGINK